MYYPPEQEATACCCAYHEWQRMVNAVPTQETPVAAAGRRQRYRYRVSGFGCHTEHQIVEFLDELSALCFCSWCELVARDMCMLSCLHVICPTCQERAFGSSTSGFALCLIDKEMLSIHMTATIPNNVRFKRVRCPCLGCDYTGYLKDLDDHLGESCAFHLTTCAKCEAVVAYKDMRSHFFTCEGGPGVFFQAADVQSFLEGLRYAGEELGNGAVSSGITGQTDNEVVSVSDLFRWAWEPDGRE